MRLWHKELISVLPRQQLLGQYRECCLIAKSIHENGTPNHILVNRVMNFPIEHFYAYTCLVRDEMLKRGYKCDFSKFTKWIDINENHKIITYSELFTGWHSLEYLRQCYYNLEEKFDCGAIPRNEWKEVKNLMAVLDPAYMSEYNN